MSCYQCPNTANLYGTVRSARNDVVATINATSLRAVRYVLSGSWLGGTGGERRDKEGERQVFAFGSMRLLS